MHSFSHIYVYTHKYVIYTHILILTWDPVIRFMLQSIYNKLDYFYKTEFCFSCFWGIRKFKVEVLCCYITTQQKAWLTIIANNPNLRDSVR